MEYQVPQFIEVEDKIIGPLTLKQFIYVAGSGGFCIAFFSYLPFIFALLLSLPIAGFGAALAFYRVNGKPFIEVIEAAFNYYVSEKLLLWKQDAPGGKKEIAVDPTLEAPARDTQKLTSGKLAELAWSLDVKSKFGSEGNPNKP